MKMDGGGVDKSAPSLLRCYLLAADQGNESARKILEALNKI